MSRPEIGLVEDGELGLQDGHLEHLQAFLLATGEAFVDVTTGKGVVQVEEVHLLAQEIAKLAHLDAAAGGIAGIDLATTHVKASTPSVQSGAQERGHRQAGHGGGVLEGQEEAQPGALVGAQAEYVDTLPDDLAAGDHVGGVAHERVGQRGLARAVAAHDGVDLTLADLQVDAAQDLHVAAGDGDHVEIADGQHAVVCGGLGCAGLSCGGSGKGGDVVGHGWTTGSLIGRSESGWTAMRAAWGWAGWPRRGSASSSSVMESSAVTMASRTRSHSCSTLQKPAR